MPIHVAILKKPFLDAILAGDKTVESRLTKNKLPPFQKIEPGERLFLKQSSGPYRATAIAGDIEFHDQLTPDRVETLRQRWQPAVGGDDEDYWQTKADVGYASFIRLTHIQPLHVGPAMKKSNGQAWFVLDESRSPILDIPLTAASLKNRALRIPARCQALREHPFTLVLPAGQEVQTATNPQGFIRWRSWSNLIDAFDLKPGDTARLIALAPHRYQLRFITQS